MYSVFVCHFFFVWHTLPCVCHLPLWWNITSFVSLERIIRFAECLRIERISLNSCLHCYRFQILFWIFCGGGNNQSSFKMFFSIFFSILEVWLTPIRMTPPKNLLVKRVCVHPSSWTDSPWYRIIRTWWWEYQWSVFCTSVIQKL